MHRAAAQGICKSNWARVWEGELNCNFYCLIIIFSSPPLCIMEEEEELLGNHLDKKNNKEGIIRCRTGQEVVKRRYSLLTSWLLLLVQQQLEEILPHQHLSCGG